MGRQQRIRDRPNPGYAKVLIVKEFVAATALYAEPAIKLQQFRPDFHPARRQGKIDGGYVRRLSSLAHLSINSPIHRVGLSGAPSYRSESSW